MNPFTFLYTEVLYRPLLNLLVGITNVLPGHGVGLSIIIVTLLVRLLLLPSSLYHAKKMQTTQTKMQSARKEIDQIKKKHKGDQSKQAQETMRIYKEAGINPASGCLPLLIQLPIFIALYRVFLVGLTPEAFDLLYGFVSAPAVVDTTFLTINLQESSLVLAVLAGAGQFAQMKWFNPAPQTPQMGADDNSAAMMASMQRNMMYVFPVMTIFISLQLPSALALYWAVSTLFGMAQQYLLKRSMHLEQAPPGI